MKITSIYFAECRTPEGAPFGAIKIGCSVNPVRRAHTLSAGQPYSCKVLATCPGGFLEEAVLHEWLRPDQISGEFFRDTDEVRRLISSTRETSRMPVAVEPGIVPRRWITQAGIANFMALHGLTVELAAELTGRKLVFFQSAIRQKSPPRRFVAALAVAAIRAGGSVDWCVDFLAEEPSFAEAA